MANIDSLNIQISASASEANKAIGMLTSNLSTLSNQLGKLNVGSLSSFANGIKTLSDGVKNLQDVKGRDISSIANGIKKFQDIDAGKIISVGTSLTTLASALSTINAVTFNAESINGIITSLSKLGTVKSTAGVDNLLRIKDTLAQFVIGMNTIEGVTFDTTNLTNLIMAISKLGNVSANNATKNLPSISAQLQNFVRQMNTIGSMTFDTTNLASLVTAISKLGRNTVTNAITNLPQLTTQLNNLMTTLSKAPTVSSNTIQMTNALANLASQGNKVGSASRSLNSGLTSTRRSMNHTTRSTRGLASAIGMFYARFFLLIRAIRKLGSAIKASMDYVENLNYFNKAFSQVASKADLSSWKELGYKSAEAYGQALQKELSRQALETTTKMSGYSVSENGMVVSARTKSLGINPTQVMKYQAMYAQMASSMGVASDTAAKMSRALTEIGADLASVRNMDFDKVWTDMASGLAGMSRTLDKYGANIRNVNLQQKLNELGIQANISALNQNDKALLRTIILLENTKYAWGDNAQTLNRGANQLRMLKSNFANLSRTIGNIFLPTVAALLPYINGLVIALQRLAERIVKLLGNTDFDWGGTGGADETSLSYLYDDADQLSDNLDDATSSAKKLKNELMGFDEINKLSDNTDDTGNTSAGGLDDAGRGLLNSAFDKVLSDYQTVWDKAFDDMGNKANEIADKIEKAFKSKNYKGIGTYISTSIRDALDSIKWDSVYKRAENFASGLAEFLNGLFRPDTFYSVGKTIANTLNTAIHSLLTFSDTFDWKNFGDSLGEGVNGFFKNFDAHEFAEGLNSFVDGLENALAEFLKTVTWSDILKKVGDFLGDLELDTVAVIIGAFTIKTATSKLKALMVAAITKKLTGITLKSLAVSFVDIVVSTGGNIIGLDMIGAELVSKLWNSVEKHLPKFATNVIQGIGNVLGGAALGAAVGAWAGPIGMLAGALVGALISSITTKIQGKSIATHIIEGLFNFNQTCDLFKVAGQFFTNAWNAFKNRKWGEIGKNIILGILSGFTGALSAVLEPIQDLMNTIVNAICKVFGIHSPAKNMYPLGENILLGIVEGFTNKIDAFTNAISNWWENDVKPWFTISKWSDIFSNIKISLTNTWDKTVGSWKTKIANWWNNDVIPWFTLTKWSNLFGNIKTAIVTKWTEITNWWENTAISRWWRDDVKPWFTVEKWEETVGGIKTAFSNIFDDIIESAKTWGSDMINGFVQGIEDAGETLEEGVKKTAKKIKKFLHFSRPDEGPLRDYETWMPDFMKGLAKGISENEYLVTDSIKSLASNMANLQDYTVDVQPNYSLPNIDYISARKTYDVNQTNTASFIGSDITNGVRAANEEQNELLREQNQLLRALLAKDNGVSARDIFDSVRNSANDYTIRTGKSPFPI